MVTPLPPDCPSMTNPNKTRRRFTPQQKQEQEAVELCLREGLTCHLGAQLLRLPFSSQARVDCSQLSIG